ncbi:serine/threonine protein kinase nrc-2, putative [Entamoeba invadens IP1]|uniref:non-specific serine/threonine protein kinase n=1 Tax=Entamoeba invadens IP1 TaxID=370355 RepID=A0A0A1U8M9_ENTIV|nr:serine/threonine protein kinase nrc-2, putative [Entamoeba invadens IP1]ELP89438.1 serine/threonine protein kinase nrc-2, putative [Entamoeba invadens IP1]|eukprot:XP_004256209.1 serine/threonine protein kinase nrc-2, putative [Entamoeba invadens IP1]
MSLSVEQPSTTEVGQPDLPKEVNLTNFRIVKLIGIGNVGRVYLVQLKGTSNYFAMKVLVKKEMEKRNKTNRVTTERDILLTTRHPFIVHLYWSFSTEMCFYFVMDYCSGGDFYHTLKMTSHRCLPEETARFYLAEVLLALEYLHLNGIIYRDLKPENVLLNGNGHIMLSDFDLSKTQPIKGDMARAIMSAHEQFKKEPSYITNSFVGTAEYLAPEVIVGYGHSGSVDWWTFGIFMYEVLYGRTPFFSRNRDTVFSQILDGEVLFPKTWTYPVSAHARDLIKALLKTDPEKRLGTKKGAEEIKSHKFFRGVKFQLIRNIPPPIVPQVKGPEDTHHFSDVVDKGDFLADELKACEQAATTNPASNPTQLQSQSTTQQQAQPQTTSTTQATIVLGENLQK